jgi:hypothetical protein
VGPDVAWLLSLQRQAGNQAVATALASRARQGQEQAADQPGPTRSGATKSASDRGGDRRAGTRAPARPVNMPPGVALQRSLKFELQTTNRVWAVKNTGDADPLLLPRKYAPTSKGFGKKAGEERGDLPAYLSVGRKGGPARPKGYVTFVEAEGPLVTEEAKGLAKGGKKAQFIRVYQFQAQVKVKDLIGKRVGKGRLTLVSQKNNAHILAMLGKYEPNTFEFFYRNADGSALDVHLDRDHRFKAGHLPILKVGRGNSGIDKTKTAQFIEVWKVAKDPKGSVEYNGEMATVERVSVVDNAKDPRRKGSFNPNTWHKVYYEAAALKGTKPAAGAVPLDVHMDTDSRLRKGQVDFMRRKVLDAAKEQTAIELQSEEGGFIEFETPKWFRDWADIEERLQDAVDMTTAINAQRGTDREITAKKPGGKALLDAIKSVGGGSLGKIVEWPARFSTAHLKGLQADKRRLLAQVTDERWRAKIQASESIPLSQYGSLLSQHEEPLIRKIASRAADAMFNKAFTAAQSTNPALDQSRFRNLYGFLLLISTYIARGQLRVSEHEPAKYSFHLMSRSDFGSMFKNLLSAEEQALFRTMVADPSDPIVSAFEAAANAELQKQHLPSIAITPTSTFFSKEVGREPGKRTFGPKLEQWLEGIVKSKDLLTGGRLSGAMGARTVSGTPGDKDFKRAQFEVRGTTMPGGNTKPASEWLTFAKDIFDVALKRASDTPDDPTTPDVDESSKTGLKG